MRLNFSDRQVLIGAGIFVALIISITAVVEPPESGGRETPSSYSAESGGAKASYMLLGELGYKVERWNNAPQDLPIPGEGYVLVLAEPERSFHTPADRGAVLGFLQTGGRVVATGVSAADLLPEAEVKPKELPAVAWSKCTAAAVSPLTRGGPISIAQRSAWKLSSTRQVAQYYCEQDAVVVSYGAGKGEVVWWASATPLTNAALTESGNLQLFLGSIGEIKSAHVLWDEYFHGEQRDAWSYVSDTPLKWLGVELALILGALLFSFSRRSGPLRPLPRRTRLHPMEFVETLGGLYQQTKAANVAVHVSYDRFRFLISRRLGLHGEIPAVELAQLISRRLGYKSTGIEQDLEKAERAIYDYELSEKEALRLAQALNDHMRALELIRHAEKTSLKKRDRR